MGGPAPRMPCAAGRRATSWPTKRNISMSNIATALFAIMMVTASGCALDKPQNDDGKTADSEETKSSGAMSLRGFDPEIARANGFEIVTLPDGATASVPKDLAAAAASGED